MKRKSWLITVTVIISMLVACEIPVEPVEVTVNSIDYIELNWIGQSVNWSTEGCLSHSSGLMYVTGQNPSCDSTDGGECILLRLHSIQYDYNDDQTIYALLDYSTPEHPEAIRTMQIQLYRYVYDEK